MNKLLLLTIALALASPCMAQTIAPSSYIGGLTSTDGLNWDPLTSTLTTGPIAPNTYGGLLGYNSSTLQWYPCSVASPCLGAGGGGGGGGPLLETNGVANASQTLLNLIQGTNITLTNSGGGVTVNSTAGGGITQLTGAVLAGPGSGSVASTIANLGASGNLPMSNGSGTFTPSGITFDSLGDMNDINSFDGLLGLTVLNTDCTVNSGTAIELAGENTGGNGGLFLQHNTSCYSGTNPNMTNISGPSINSIYSEDGLPFWIIGELGGAISLGDGTDQPNLVVNHVGQIAGGSGVALSYFGTTSANGMTGGILASLPSTAPGGGAGVPGEVVLATTAQKTITINSTACVLGGTCTVTTTSPISGATAGQVLIAGSATTATSSIAINGAGAGLVTGPSAPTSGDVAFFTGGAGAITDGLIAGANLVTAASALTANQIVLGAGSKTTTVLGSLGTTTTVLHGNAVGAPSFGAVVLTTDVSGNLPNANLATQTANTVLGALTATTPSGLAVPSCSGATNALTWTSGTGFGCNTISAGTGTVTSFSAGTLSPLFTTSVATATTTPALSFTLTNAAANTVFGNPTGSSAAPSYTSAPSVVTLTTSTSVTSPLFLSGTPAITDTGIWMQATGNTNSYYQASLQNTNAGATASTDLVINNDQATATTHFIDMGINSSGFTGTGSLNIAGAGYLYTNTGDFVLGTSTANAIHFVYNSGTTDTMLVNANGVSFPTITTTASTAATCFNGTLGSITNVGCAAGATTLAGLAAGLAPSSSGTYDFNNNAITTTGIITGNSVTSGNYRTPNGSTSLNFAVMSGGNWTANNPFITVTAPVVPSSLAATPSQVATSGTFSNTGTTTGSWIGVSLGNTFGASTSNVYNGSAPIQQLRLSPTINVATTSTTGYAALMVNVTETSISAGTTNYLTRLQQGGADRFTVTNTGFANAVQLNSTLGSGTVTNTPATGVTSVTCQTTTCNVNGGTYTVVGGTATTGTFVTLAWPTTTTAWRCTTNMNGGGTFLGLGHSVATATGMTVSSAITILSTTFTFDYSCQP